MQQRTRRSSARRLRRKLSAKPRQRQRQPRTRRARPNASQKRRPSMPDDSQRTARRVARRRLKLRAENAFDARNKSLTSSTLKICSATSVLATAVRSLPQQMQSKLTLRTQPLPST